MPDEESMAPGGRGRSLPMTLIIVIVVAVLEAAILIIFLKFFNVGPETAFGEEGKHALVGGESTSQPALVEVELLKGFRVPNSKSGRTYIYDIDITVVVQSSRKDEVVELQADRDGEIRDRVAQVIRGADPRVLAEDDFKVLRSQLKYTLSDVAQNKGLIRKILIPRCVPLRTE